MEVKVDINRSENNILPDALKASTEDKNKTLPDLTTIIDIKDNTMHLDDRSEKSNTRTLVDDLKKLGDTLSDLLN